MTYGIQLLVIWLFGYLVMAGAALHEAGQIDSRA